MFGGTTIFWLFRQHALVARRDQNYLVARELNELFRRNHDVAEDSQRLQEAPKDEPTDTGF